MAINTILYKSFSAVSWLSNATLIVTGLSYLLIMSLAYMTGTLSNEDLTHASRFMLFLILLTLLSGNVARALRGCIAPTSH